MPRFIVFSKMSPSGQRAMLSGQGQEHLAGLAAEVERAGGKVVEQWALLGPYDFCSVVEVRDNDTAQLLRVADQSADAASRSLHPAIDLDLFVRLLGQSTENTGPYRWQVSLPARAVRRCLRRFAYTGDTERYFKPFTVIGGEHLAGLHGPAIFIANHASFVDVSAMYSALPNRYRSRIAFPAAADRFFIRGRRELRKQGWWFSLVYNSFPMKRGGGRQALAHSDWLIERGWSIGIFPEGARTSAAKLARFRMGPAILATTHGVPVVPMYLDGLGAIRPKGSRQMQPGPVTVRIGAPLRFPVGSDASAANRQLHHAVSELGAAAAAARRAARAEATASEAEGAGAVAPGEVARRPAPV